MSHDKLVNQSLQPQEEIELKEILGEGKKVKFEQKVQFYFIWPSVRWLCYSGLL